MLPILPIVMAGASLVKGIVDGGRAGRMEKDAQDAARRVQRDDPGMTKLLQEIGDRQRYAENGTSKMMAYKRGLIQDSQNAYQQGVFQSSGGNAGAVVDSLLAGQGLSNRSKLQAAAETEQLAPQYLAMKQPIVSDQADRRLSLQLYDRDTASARAARARSDSNRNIYGAIAMLGSVDWSGSAPSTRSSPGMMGDRVKAIKMADGRVDTGKLEDNPSDYGEAFRNYQNPPPVAQAPIAGPVAEPGLLDRSAAPGNNMVPYAQSTQADAPAIDWSNLLGGMISNPSQRPTF